jgi:hypothetical protein
VLYSYVRRFAVGYNFRKANLNVRDHTAARVPLIFRCNWTSVAQKSIREVSFSENPFYFMNPQRKNSRRFVSGLLSGQGDQGTDQKKLHVDQKCYVLCACLSLILPDDSVLPFISWGYAVWPHTNKRCLYTLVRKRLYFDLEPFEINACCKFLGPYRLRIRKHVHHSQVVKGRYCTFSWRFLGVIQLCDEINSDITIIPVH